MAQMMPQATVDVLRGFNNFSVDVYGIDCLLYIPNNLDAVDRNTVYNITTGVNYNSVQTKVFLLWSPDSRQLRKLGIYTEADIPIVAWFRNDLGIVVGSYFSVDVQYIPSSYDTDEFEITDVLIKGAYDAVVLNAFKVAPRRKL